MATLAPKTTATEQSSMCLPPFQIDSPSRGSRPLVTAKQAARLAKKRARDRRSQQAMRCRNRSELESLRLQVVELSEQLQLSTRALENKTLRQENEHLRRQLDDIQYILRRSRTPIPSCTIAFDSAILERWWSKRSIVRSPSSMNGSPPAPTTTLTAPRDTVTDTDTSGLSTPIWLPCRSMPSPHVPPTCPSDRILQRFIEEQKRALQTQSDGTPPSPSVAHIMATLLDTYMEIDNLPKKVACLYVLSTVVNWLILQTQEAFELMPVWMRPVAAQIQIPHPAWIDRIIW
ncbi:hypothetical protein SEUCBS140593_000894 [Sporothrix eucalyptigena]|uniref:BZIP domain-containing protein n=1 Tax=Sporothrix eucalyptigena TaxID=1812306 RepID=A0ABP0ATN2_9PEZI